MSICCAADGGQEASRRIRVRDEPRHFDDLLQGRIDYNLARESGDFIVHRADELFAYQLAVTVDDMEQHITHVVRGSDLLHSTPKQIHLFEQLGRGDVPAYLHIPVATHVDGQKLSKQSHAPALDETDPAPQLVAALRFLGQTPPADLGQAPLQRVWSWAMTHWSRKQLPKSVAQPWAAGHA